MGAYLTDLGVVFLLLSVGTLVGLALTRQGRALLRVPTKGDKHRLTVGCWSGTLGTLMAEVKRRRQSWTADEATQELWVSQYKALRALGKATVARREK